MDKTIGGTDTNGFAINVPYSSFSATDLIGTKPVQTPQVTQTNPTSLITGISQPTTQYDQNVTDSQNKVSQADTSISQVLGNILGDVGSLSGQTADKQALETQYNTTGLAKQVRDLQNLQRQQTLSYLQGVQNVENKVIPMEFITGQQQSLARQHAIDSMATSANLLAAQGSLTAAQDMVTKALDLKYEPIKQRIEAQKFLLEQLGGISTRARQDRTDALNRQEKQLEIQRKNDEDSSKLIIDASQFAPADILQKAREIKNKGGSATDVAMALGKYGSNYLSNEKLKVELAKARIDYAKSAQEYSTTQTPEVSSWVKNINEGKAKLSDVPQKLKSAVSIGLSTGQGPNTAKLQDYQNKLDLIDSIENSGALTSVVGPSALGRIGYTFNRATGEAQDFTAKVDQLTKGLTLQNLIDAKAKGATFGALSEGELRLLSDSATRLNSYRKEDSSGKIYYDVNENGFKNALNEIKYLTQKAYQTEVGSSFVGTGNPTVDSYIKASMNALKNANTISISQQGGFVDNRK